MKPRPKEKRAFEEFCARKLVLLLCGLYRLPLQLLAVQVEPNWKIIFSFRSLPGAPRRQVGTVRYGRRPGLEIHWDAGAGDVDAWQFDGDVASLVTHGFWQILKEKFSRRCERPSKLLALVEKQNAPKNNLTDFPGPGGHFSASS